MDTKYTNIFWHQGVKLFEQEYLKSKTGQIRIAHLENDVTKALLNVLQYCNPKVLNSVLRMISIKDPAESMEFDFQITTGINFHNFNNKIMLSIVTSSTPNISDQNYAVTKPIPDAALYNKNTVILIESKTQSPLVREQIENHKKHFLGSEAKDKILTWEDLSENLNHVAKTLDKFDRFLIQQFTSFLELIGIAKFRGFNRSDFEMLNQIGRISSDDYLDFKRILYRKIEKFMEQLYDGLSGKIGFKSSSWKVAKVSGRSIWIWSAIYFYDDNPDIHVNHYPNINFIYGPGGIELSINAETKNSVSFLIKKISQDINSLNQTLSKLHDFTLNAYFKLQYFPRDNFVWLLIDGYPKSMDRLDLKNLESDIKYINKKWSDVKHTLLYRMKTKDIRNEANDFFTENEISFAKNRNPNPNYGIRITQTYTPHLIEQQKNVVKFFSNEILKFRELLKYIFN